MIAVADPVPAIPANRPQNDFAAEMTAFERIKINSLLCKTRFSHHGQKFATEPKTTHYRCRKKFLIIELYTFIL